MLIGLIDDGYGMRYSRGDAGVMGMLEDDKKLISRREFARNAMLAAASAAVLGAHGAAQTEGTVAPPNPAATSDGVRKDAVSSSPPSKPLSPDDHAEVEARMSAILRRHGHRLSSEQKTDIERLLREGQPSLADFRAFPLINSDEPATVLHVLVEKGAEHA